MTIQNTYADRLDKSRVGHIRKGELCNLISRSVEDATPIPFGVPVTIGAADNTCKAVTAAGDFIVGVTARDRSVDGSSPDGFPQYESAQICDFGIISVEVTEAVAVGTVAFFNITGQAWGNAGAIEIGHYISSTTGAGIAEVRVRIGG